MPTVPGEMQQALDEQWQEQQRKRPTPEHILMTAADMKAKGQLYQHPTDYTDPKANLRLPTTGFARGAGNTKPQRKRR